MRKITPLQITNPYKASAYYSGGGQSITGGGFSKMALNTENFDPNNNFDSTTNYRYTAPVTGYYRVHGAASTAQGTSFWIPSIYKNGTEFRRGAKINVSANGAQGAEVNDLIYLAAGDYIELWVFTGATVVTENGAPFTRMTVELEHV